MIFADCFLSLLFPIAFAATAAAAAAAAAEQAAVAAEMARIAIESGEVCYTATCSNRCFYLIVPFPIVSLTTFQLTLTKNRPRRQLKRH